MSLMVNRGKQFQIATEGLHQGTLAAITDVGEVETTYKGNTKLVDVMRFIWLIDEVDDESGDPLMVFQRVPKSTHPKSTFGKLFKSMTGREAQPDEDALQLLGQSAGLQMEHTEKDGQTYSNIILVVKPTKGAEPVEIPADFQAPKARKGEGQTYLAGAAALNKVRSATQETAASEVSEEDIPF